MKRKKVVTLAGILSGCLLGSAAIGAEPPGNAAGSETRLEQIVVTATRTEQDLESAPGSVSVVTKEEIDKRNITTVDEAINIIPGVITTRGKGMMDRMSAITLRGIPGQSRTLVMLDDITLNSPYAGSVFSVGIAPGSLEQIEVVKGPASSLYGGYAMGGVVNLITQMPEKREFTLTGGYGSALDSGNGMENSRRVAVSYGDKFLGKFKVYLHNDYVGTNGYRSDFNVQSSQPTAGITGYSNTTDYSGAARYRIGDKGKNGTWQDNLTVKTEYEFSPDTRVRFTFLKSSGEYFYDDPATYLRNSSGAEVWTYGTVREASFLGANGGSDQYLYGLAAETAFSPVKLKLNLGYLYQASSWGSTPTSAAPPNSATRSGGPGKLSDTPAGAINADLQASLPLLDRHLLTFGGAFRSGWAHSKEHTLTNWQDENSTAAMTYKSKGTDRTFALFAQDEIMLLDKLTLFFGFRQDWWETFDGYANQVGSSGYPKNYDSRSASSFSPKGAIVYKPFDQTTLKLSGGKAFRAPTAYDLYRTWTTSSGITYAGNPDLKPETTISWDAGVSQGLWEGARVSATYFENYISDLIYSTSTTATWKDKVNAGKAESKGVELEAEQKFGKQLRLFANYTYSDATIKENSAAPASTGKRMTDVPEHMFNVGADLEYGDFGALATGRYVGKRYGNDTNIDTVNGVQGSYDPYFTVDLKLRYRITSWATASLSVSNLLDEHYYSYYLAPGRSAYGELSFKF
ncbi:TonB-dependent receptor [Geotalea uraniireducens]|uniref:TonB-dependent receptor n=1 Tax=Geotalea uraniireducens (strain Rf4) TaxID=351605 RepID=A5GBR6_GEOUR|nr:TonB-dependent receptor [Geotalea uraniireducens]ABQ24986.1 TonB-dependent receptor [Geotalea uraniireducens Rf4]